MAQLKDSLVSGSLRVTDNFYTSTAQFRILNAPTSSDGTTYGPGTSGYVLKSNGTSVYWGADIATKATKANLTDTTMNALAYYTDIEGTFGQTSNITYIAPIDAELGSTKGKVTGIFVTGTAYGNTAANLGSNTVNVFRYGDPGPQIRFGSSASASERGAIIWSDNSTSNNLDQAFYFVGRTNTSNSEANVGVVTKTIVARTRLTIGQNYNNTSYVLYSNGASYINGALTVNGNSLFTGNFEVRGNAIRFRNANNDNNQASTNPWVTSLLIGDGQHVMINEYHDDYLSIKSKGLILNTRSTAIAVYNNTSTYAVGAVVWYNKDYYVCKTAIETAEEWTAAHWTKRDPSGDVLVEGDMIPWTNNNYTLGNSSYKWSNVYATTFTGNLTGNASGTASNITGILALANFTKGAANTALMGQGDSSNPSYVSVSPSISITAGTASDAPKINLTVLGVSGTAQELTKASTSAYGATKLYDGVNSSSTELAATAKAVKTAYDKAVNIIAESNALVYKGTIDGNSSATNGGAYTVAADCGDVYIASTAGYVNGLYVELGDMLICNTDETVQATSSNYTTIRDKWDIIQTSNGTVSTSETSVAEGEIPVFKGTTGRFIQNSEKSFTTNAPTSSSGDSTIPTSKAVWTTVNTAITGLDVAAVGGGTGEYVSKISEADGKISATISTTSVSNTWTAGTTAGPTIKTTVNGITGTAVAIPSASNTASGIITTGNQTFAGIKTFANTTASTSTGTGAVLVSGGLGVTGQVTAARLAANGSNTSYNLYVNGTSLLNGNTTVNGNLVPGANNTKTLGSTDAKWSKLYVGSSESYGNAYQPVYWNDGVPTVSYPVQYSTWSITSGDNTATLTGTDIFTEDTYVISLVVTSGEQYLNGPITWTSAANTLTLSTAATSGDVEGYVLTSIGTATGATCASSSVTT